MTSYTIDLEEPSSSGNEPGAGNPWASMQFINSAGDGYGPHATNMGDIANKIPSKPPLKKSCEKCGKRPDQEGKGYSVCGSCKVSCYCSRECQTSDWKEHKRMCASRVEHAKIEKDLEAKAIRTNGPFVSQTAFRKWYYDNVDIVDYTIAQTLELYKGRAHSLWQTHAVVFSLRGGKRGTSVSSDQISFHDAEAASFTTLSRKDRLDISPVYFRALGAGRRIILIFILNQESDLMGFESHDLPLDEEWAAMEKDDMWRMHIRMRGMAKILTGMDSTAESSTD
ncbi:hypothetical protein DFH07DRAFT_957948 [Mycena maculata]|uniref:MYND-type domain-containing protein n=1 Tax=Mycena maculata TaxID=230809 RepID=A0AAD7NGU9_9AGAR|nr:hypothetical protein DFH07DRAFT_957948 [Mycena maculata]